MKLKVMGTSCSWFARRNTSFFIDDSILLDASSGTFKYIIGNSDIAKVRTIFITHFHEDHFIDTGLFITSYMRNYGGNRVGKLKVYGPKGIANKIIELKNIMFGSEDECSLEQTLKFVDFIEVEENTTYTVGKYKVKAFKMEHGKPETFGYKFIEQNGKIVSFTADTIYCENVKNLLEDADVAFVDFTTIKSHPSHMSKKDFLRLRKDYKNTIIYPVHTTDEVQKYVEDNNLNPLYDGQVLNI